MGISDDVARRISDAIPDRGRARRLGRGARFVAGHASIMKAVEAVGRAHIGAAIVVDPVGAESGPALVGQRIGVGAGTAKVAIPVPVAVPVAVPVTDVTVTVTVTITITIPGVRIAIPISVAVTGVAGVLGPVTRAARADRECQKEKERR